MSFKHVFSLASLMVGTNLFNGVIALCFLGPFGPLDLAVAAKAAFIALIPNGSSRSKVVFDAGSGTLLSISVGMGLSGFAVVLVAFPFSESSSEARVD